LNDFVSSAELLKLVSSKEGKSKHQTIRILPVILTTLILISSLFLTFQRNFAASITYVEHNSKNTNPHLESGKSPVLSEYIDIQVDGLENLEPAVIYNSKHKEYLVVWYTKQGALTWDIWARRVGINGNLESIFNVASVEAKHLTQPDVAYSPVQDEYLVVYNYEVTSTNTDIYGTRFKWNGSLIGAPFPIITAVDKQIDPSLAYNSTDDEYLVVYGNEWAGGLRDIAAQRINASDGSLISWANIATGTGEDRDTPDVAYNPARNQYLITYTKFPSPINIRGKVALANLDGVSISPEIELCCTGIPGAQWGTQVATGPDEFLVTFQIGLFNGPIYGRRVSGEGTPLGPASAFDISSTYPSGINFSQALAYGAEYGYLVAISLQPEPTQKSNVYGRYVMAGSDSAAGGEFGIDLTEFSQNNPSVSCTPSGDCLVVYEDNWPDGTDYEIRARFVRPHRVFLPIVMKD
jgi:hypothetical protein